MLARKWHFNGTPILLRSFAVPIQRMCTAVGVYLAAASLPWAIPGIAKLLLVCFRLVMTLLVCERPVCGIGSGRPAACFLQPGDPL